MLRNNILLIVVVLTALAATDGFAEKKEKPKPKPVLAEFSFRIKVDCSEQPPKNRLNVTYTGISKKGKKADKKADKTQDKYTVEADTWSEWIDIEAQNGKFQPAMSLAIGPISGSATADVEFAVDSATYPARACFGDGRKKGSYRLGLKLMEGRYGQCRRGNDRAVQPALLEGVRYAPCGTGGPPAETPDRRGPFHRLGRRLLHLERGDRKPRAARDQHHAPAPEKTVQKHACVNRHRKVSWAVYAPPGYGVRLQRDIASDTVVQEWADKQAGEYMDAGFAPDDVAICHISDEPGWYYPKMFDKLAQDEPGALPFPRIPASAGVCSEGLRRTEWKDVTPLGRSVADSDLASRKLYYWTHGLPVRVFAVFRQGHARAGKGVPPRDTGDVELEQLHGTVHRAGRAGAQQGQGQSGRGNGESRLAGVRENARHDLPVDRGLVRGRRGAAMDVLRGEDEVGREQERG